MAENGAALSRRFFVLLLLLWLPARADEPARLDKPPRLLHFVEASPPPALAERGHAEVVLGIDVDEHGAVQKVDVLRSAGDGFDEAALAAARQFQFAPGESAGKPVPVRVTYSYKFLLKLQPSPTPEPSASPTPESGPTVPLSGKVLRKGDRVPLAGVSVIVDDAPKVLTDDDGNFAFEALPVGKHVLHLRHPLINNTDAKIELAVRKKLQLTLYAEAKARYRSVVRAQKAVVETVEMTLDASELKRIPGTQGDTLKAVQNLPGVARAPFGGGQLIVWGSSPQDTRTYVDGVYIPTLYHFGGLRSTVNSEVVSSLTFMPGGYGVDHGRGLGGVIEVETRRPRTDGYHGFVQLDLIDGSLLVEGPISKNVSFEAGLRRSWIDAFLPLFTTSNFQLSPVYYDYQAKVFWRASPRDDVDLFIFGSDDAVKVIAKQPDPSVSAEFNSHTYYHRILARWQHRWGKLATFTLTPSIGYDVPFQFKATFGNTNLSVDEETLEYNLRAVARVNAASWLRVDAGLDFEGNRWTLGALAPQGLGRATTGQGGGGAFRGGFANDGITLYTNDVAPYAALNFSFFQGKLTITPQLRLEILTAAGYQGSPDAFSHVDFVPEPRLAIRYKFTKWMAIKAAVGVYHQQPDPGNYLKEFGNPKLGPEFGIHYVAGFDFDPMATLHIELTAFYKDLRNLVVGGERAGDPNLENDGIGRVYGGELLVRQELFHGFFGWIAYTLSRSERKDHDDTPWRLFQFDQTHILTLIGSYQFGRGYQIGIRFRYVTGNPYTPVIGAYYDAVDDRYVPVRATPFSGRLHAFNQLDLRFDKKWTFRKWAFSLYLDIQNLYDAKNPEGVSYNFNYTKTTAVTGLPFLPVLGIRGDF
jgi:TonB family protein